MGHDVGGPRLAPPWRKLLVVLHIGSSVGLLGTDAAVLLLGAAGAAGRDPVGVYPAAQLIGGALLVPLALAALVTGTALGLLTRWGLLRHWWVALKLLLTLAGTVLALTVLAPALGEAAEAARSGSVIPQSDRLGLVRDTSAASVVLLTTLVLSVAKPFGRLRNVRP